MPEKQPGERAYSRSPRIFCSIMERRGVRHGEADSATHCQFRALVSRPLTTSAREASGPPDRILVPGPRGHNGAPFKETDGSRRKLPVALLPGILRRPGPCGRPGRRRRGDRGRLRLCRRGASGSRRRWMRSDGALQICKIADGRSAIGPFAAHRKLAFDRALIICLLNRGKLFAVGDGSLDQIRKPIGQGLDARPRYFPTHRGGATKPSDIRRNLPQGVDPVAALGGTSGHGRGNQHRADDNCLTSATTETR
jgi:hypothetical protein